MDRFKQKQFFETRAVDFYKKSLGTQRKKRNVTKNLKNEANNNINYLLNIFFQAIFLYRAQSIIVYEYR